MITLDDFMSRYPEFLPVKLTFNTDMNLDFRAHIFESVRQISFDDYFTCTVSNTREHGQRIKIEFTPTERPEPLDSRKSRQAAWKVALRLGTFTNKQLHKMAKYMHVETLLENFPLTYIRKHEAALKNRLDKVLGSKFYDCFIQHSLDLFYNCLARNRHVTLADLPCDVDPCSLWYNPNVPDEYVYNRDYRLCKLLVIGRNKYESDMSAFAKRSITLLTLGIVNFEDEATPMARMDQAINARNSTIFDKNTRLCPVLNSDRTEPITARELSAYWSDAKHERLARFNFIDPGHPSYVTYQAMKKLEQLMHDCGVHPVTPVEEIFYVRRLPEEQLEKYFHYVEREVCIFDLNVIKSPSTEFLERYHFWSSQLSSGNIPEEFAIKHLSTLDRHALAINPHLSEKFFSQKDMSLCWSYLFLNPSLTLEFFERSFQGFSMILLSLNPLFQQLKEEGETEKQVVRESVRYSNPGSLVSLVFQIIQEESVLRSHL